MNQCKENSVKGKDFEYRKVDWINKEIQQRQQEEKSDHFIVSFLFTNESDFSLAMKNFTL